MAHDNLMKAIDVLEDLEDELKHLQNLVEVLGIGFAHNPFDGDEYSNSAAHILAKYIEKLQNEHIASLSALLESMK